MLYLTGLLKTLWQAKVTVVEIPNYREKGRLSIIQAAAAHLAADHASLFH